MNKLIFCLPLACLFACGDGAKKPGDAGVDAVLDARGLCFSPTANLSIAYERGAVGCACNPAVDRDVCVQGYALICEAGHWMAVEDGPCMPVPRWDAAADRPVSSDASADRTTYGDAEDAPVVDASTNTQPTDGAGDGREVCFSPTGSLSIVHERGAVGCACDPVIDRDVCVQGTALVCSNARWMAVKDGPCMPWPRWDAAID